MSRLSILRFPVDAMTRRPRTGASETPIPGPFRTLTSSRAAHRPTALARPLLHTVGALRTNGTDIPMAANR